MKLRRVSTSVPTDAGGAGDVWFLALSGMIHAVRYIADATTPYAATVDFSITLKESQTPVWVENNVTASKIVFPRSACHDGAGATVEMDTGVLLRTMIPVVSESVRIVISNGGASKTGAFELILIQNTYDTD